MNVIIALLAIIAVSEVSRLILTHRPTSKKAHFKAKFEGVEKMIYDLEFKRFKTCEIREGIRKDYDVLRARKESLDKQVGNTPEDNTRIEDTKVVVNRDVSRLEGQIKRLDDEVNGRVPNQEDHEGVIGINEQIDSLRELRNMLKDWIRSI